ncbi:Ups2p [Ascoidea rubescens DSM 1968]|uniref:MSF1-domain-containing protein n=1 Tax=Ascoidea rubescens DSM 1968 TaxID=1344418 RepID=A0A1D2VDK8_9ASCO|nr:MSF1-domain-containing protein [Ascoidea rubescens DSM 1968]ODV59547.1 MSF1-domain-containing protein [Ascoidea rubescens DSM 1968]
MKIFESQQSFNYSWNLVSFANWKKYPNNKSAHVVAVDVLRREVDPQTGILRTERLITCQQQIPSWLLVLVGGKDKSYVREISEIDPKNQKLTMRSINLTMNKVLSVYETVIYKPDPIQPLTKTIFLQEAQITAYASFKKLCNKIEDWSVERFDSNSKLGKAGFDEILKQVANIKPNPAKL